MHPIGWMSEPGSPRRFRRGSESPFHPGPTATLVAVVGAVGVMFLVPWALLVMLGRFDAGGHNDVITVWGRDYERIQCCDMVLPLQSEAATLDQIRTTVPDPVVVRLLAPPLGWFGLTDTPPEPAGGTWVVFLRVGDDAYVPYVHAERSPGGS